MYSCDLMYYATVVKPICLFFSIWLVCRWHRKRKGKERKSRAIVIQCAGCSHENKQERNENGMDDDRSTSGPLGIVALARVGRAACAHILLLLLLLLPLSETHALHWLARRRARPKTITPAEQTPTRKNQNRTRTASRLHCASARSSIRWFAGCSTSFARTLVGQALGCAAWAVSARRNNE